ncbi:AraC family transcriptional regulator [Chitinophaga nivalis]|uniref:AraC family transcriptional regulator n=1 Tax=Chitinophaga nivalis TaxID=2991709 RepID=A0ABT3IHE6_9BACT|nr:AraC family transcriptional regulator [Chitinophaga nivalis]MCW3466937.1 AraC family transcriptional regulator [Chitinophaga nivalis]MCW3483372.1 AraC family transcriptional regulator [Chitinophaga nivalis]
MKVLQFTIPVAHDKTIMTQKDVMPFFYPHLHRHEEIQLTWIQHGHGTLIVENNMHAFWPNEIYWIGSNQPHVLKSEIPPAGGKNKKNVQALTLFFNPDGKLSPVLALPEFKKISAFITQCKSGFKIPESFVADISSRMLRIHQSQGIPQFLAFTELLHLFLQIKSPEPLISGSPLSVVNEQEGIRIGYIYNYIMQHYDTDIKLEDIAKEAHMTPQAFCRYFKKHTRLTFVSFLNEVRVNEACKKLAGGSFDSIATVAYNCGFNSIANFNRVFKTVTGKSPRTYLREYEEIEEHEQPT